MNRVLTLLVIASCACTALGADWTNWRGPTDNGVAPPGEYPTKWNETENVVWKIALPGRGASTPIVLKQKIYLTYGKDADNVLGCFDWNGKTLWEVSLGKERKGKNAKATGSNPSPVTDGKRVFAYFKSGDLACTDLNGKIVWQKNLPKEYGEEKLWLDANQKNHPLWWDLGTSPVLTPTCVVIAVMQSGPSYLVALDKDSGEEVWKQDRNLGAPVEAAQSYTTPVVSVDAMGKGSIYVAGADHVTAHDAMTGAETWRVGGLNPEQNGYFRSIASPVLCGDILVTPYARGKTITAVRVGGKGDVTKSHVAWFKEELGADVPTPAAQNGRVYVCADKGDVTCLDGKTGNELWQAELEKNRNAFSSSPILAGGNVYVTREDGKTFVLAADTGEVVGTGEISTEKLVATPTFVDNRIFIRTPDSLYCIGGASRL
jgi:outer membrane protein assembly factor BamB